ncbi:hypothetical protein CRE_20504 [Caenorhabditis remanei]|uniref:Uncharacterized protein n=1 Tax=Caenorhabditis remanei TaxID=31234 RepID=E3N8B1_CAERE|nr:hypothetical protein CRE_20504 [Caenorhabditis remanei]
MVMSAENIRTEHSALLQVNETVKIQSSQSIKQSNRRRHQAMRRCLMMATIQVSLNAPYYTLQLCDEIFSLRTSTHVYLYLDAFLYFIYLTQFSMIYFYTNLLVSPRGKICRQPPKMPVNCTSSLRSEYTMIPPSTDYQLGFNREVTNMNDLKSDDVELGLQKFKASNERMIHRFHRLLLQILSRKSLKITEEFDLHGPMV